MSRRPFLPAAPKFRSRLLVSSRLPLWCASGMLLLDGAVAQKPESAEADAQPEESAPAQSAADEAQPSGDDSSAPSQALDEAEADHPADGSADALTAAASRLGEERLAFLKVQLALDAAGFGPGRLDARQGEFTSKAVARWNEAKPDQALALSDGDKLDRVRLPETLWDAPVLTEVTLSEEDAEQVGELPEGPEAKAKLEALPYASLLELVAERFHAEEDFIIELNELGENPQLEVGQTLVVPNVKEPFSLERVRELAEAKGGDDADSGAEAAAEEDSDEGDDAQTAAADDEKATSDEAGEAAAKAEVAEEPAPAESPAETKPTATKVRVLLSENQVEVIDGEAVIRSWPVTIGPAGNESPAGEEKIVVIQWLPEFRWDQQMLDEGVRSDDAHMLPPGPNSPVGIVWIGLSADGIGLHGTADPDGIGRSDSHGCIRLSNWDALALGQLVDEGTIVELVK